MANSFITLKSDQDSGVDHRGDGARFRFCSDGKPAGEGHLWLLLSPRGESRPDAAFRRRQSVEGGEDLELTTNMCVGLPGGVGSPSKCGRHPGS